MTNSQNELQSLLETHHEWLLIDAAGRGFALLTTEIELSFAQNRLRLGFLSDSGFQTWRVTSYRLKNKEIRVELARNFDLDKTIIRFVPRTSAGELGESVELARLEKATAMARLIAADFPSLKVVRVELNKENGRLAQLMLENRADAKHTAVIGDVTDSMTPEVLLATALVRLTRLEKRRKKPCESLWIVAEKASAAKLRRLHALFTRNWQNRILIKEVVREIADDSARIIDRGPMELNELWRGRPREVKLASSSVMSDSARQIVENSPGEIDVVFSKHGETLRYRGLAFARVRRMLDRERVWFGIDRFRRPLNDSSFDAFGELLDAFREFRCATPPTKRHQLYHSAPEAWLESILRRDIRLLDANLVLSPLYHQFRADRDRIDLLALRKDGRLVIIELKTSIDREMVFQVADYWRKIERQRRGGVLQKSGLFGAAKIADAPAICYLAAPTLAFHRDFDLLASTLVPEIEIHRFNLAENWRKRLKVLERRACGQTFGIR